MSSICVIGLGRIDRRPGRPDGRAGAGRRADGKARRRERVAFMAGPARGESYLSLKLNGAGTIPALVAPG